MTITEYNTLLIPGIMSSASITFDNQLCAERFWRNRDGHWGCHSNQKNSILWSMLLAMHCCWQQTWCCSNKSFLQGVYQVLAVTDAIYALLALYSSITKTWRILTSRTVSDRWSQLLGEYSLWQSIWNGVHHDWCGGWEPVVDDIACISDALHNFQWPPEPDKVTSAPWLHDCDSQSVQCKVREDPSETITSEFRYRAYIKDCQ